jgi:hypothetical protein
MPPFPTTYVKVRYLDVSYTMQAYELKKIYIMLNASIELTYLSIIIKNEVDYANSPLS